MEADDSRIADDGLIALSSSKSTRVSLDAVKHGKAKLNKRRQSLLERVSDQNQWAVFAHGMLEMMDLAYLTAATGHEFAILRGKSEDILYHGTGTSCPFDDDSVLKSALLGHKYEIYGHSHPGEPFPMASNDDKWALRNLGQKKSKLISGMTGICIDFDAIG